ncbi:hypothetical protein [Corynebacterium bovis]|uniref:Uncharacterized protein n=1 Tax=Corynebacterium bovis DSM 20582 = CIP 54.80 TaxID=927655 RepID=A0A8H9Y8M7_9CORY|nr:hypothetical protein [Corynebacterium bovis]MBB3116839.1 hypothetical protein [Corynebacterium bovis DSM 20582 = CIP 54.80]QQC47494.1 hypothetical protein I6I09_00330 [Corynebacterium bovis]RRQ14522.1 hypothetical protein CXF47_01625 [Corynebacterium bovis]RRQ16787.1 hypothetical protein CXF46_01645 [Corynebacterium bovis]WJY77257.1 hypothetical protein CBOVI_03615 [Corynebacterium bovis DSM 20582 = CIP 54.80]
MVHAGNHHGAATNNADWLNIPASAPEPPPPIPQLVGNPTDPVLVDYVAYIVASPPVGTAREQ